MPKNIGKLDKCTYVSMNGTPCLAPRLKVSTYCRHHAPDENTKTARKRQYQTYLQLHAKRLAADPERLDLTIEIQIMNTLILICKQCMDNQHIAMAMLKLMSTRRKMIETQERLEATRAYWSSLREQVRTIIIAVLKENLSAEQFKGFKEGIMSSDITSTIKEMFEQTFSELDTKKD